MHGAGARFFSDALTIHSMKAVYTLEDLVSREVLDAGASKPARLAVLGWPIAHSASPRMHQPALDVNGIDARYIRLEVEPGKISEAFSGMRALGFIGCNVTVPHKLNALENCTVVHPDAVALGAVNTVRFDQDETRGFNTDGPGFARAIEDDFGIPLHSLRVAIAGAGGGAGQAIAMQCVQMGVKKLVLVNRTLEKLGPLADRLNQMNGSASVRVLSFEYADLEEECRSCDLIVNTSSVGLKTGDDSILPASCLKPSHLVYDTIYQPPVTPLLLLAQEQGCRTSNGFSMLLHQGALAFQHWFPNTDPLAVMRAALTQRA
ncbi:MAG: shikimate dehydrogenase [Gloeobacteraceae cyanobacterium ES-bin-144]|nr:shikimate dehydrogenase [Verrucomicrobiales bacterium]